LHGRDVAPRDLAILVDHRRRHIHAILAARSLEVAGRTGVTKAAAAEVNADPDKAVFIAHQVDVMVAGSDGAELRDGLLPIRPHVGFAPGIIVVEQLVFGPLLVGAPNAKGNGLVHVLDDHADIAFDLAERRIEAYGHVATADVEPNAGNADLLFICDYAANRLGCPECGRHRGAWRRTRGARGESFYRE